MSNQSKEQWALKRVQQLELGAIAPLESIENKEIKTYVKKICQWTLEYYDACAKAYPLSVQEQLEQVNQGIEQLEHWARQMEQECKQEKRASIEYKEYKSKILKKYQDKAAAVLIKIQTVVEQEQYAFEKKLQKEGYAWMSNEVMHLYGMLEDKKKEMKYKGQPLAEKEINKLYEIMGQYRQVYPDGALVYTCRKGNRNGISWWEKLQSICSKLEIQTQMEPNSHPYRHPYEITAYKMINGSWEPHRDSGPCHWVFGSKEGYDHRHIDGHTPILRGDVYQWSKNLEKTPGRSACLPIVCARGLGLWSPVGTSSGQALSVQCIEGVSQYKVSFENSLMTGERPPLTREDGPCEVSLNVREDRLEKVVWGINGVRINRKNHPYVRSQEEKKQLLREVKKTKEQTQIRANGANGEQSTGAMQSLVSEKKREMKSKHTLKKTVHLEKDGVHRSDQEKEADVSIEYKSRKKRL